MRNVLLTWSYRHTPICCNTFGSVQMQMSTVVSSTFTKYTARSLVCCVVMTMEVHHLAHMIVQLSLYCAYSFQYIHMHGIYVFCIRVQYSFRYYEHDMLYIVFIAAPGCHTSVHGLLRLARRRYVSWRAGKGRLKFHESMWLGCDVGCLYWWLGLMLRISIYR